jgi:hypothetical protein
MFKKCSPSKECELKQEDSEVLQDCLDTENPSRCDLSRGKTVALATRSLSRGGMAANETK